jgi:hypothetical protein
MLMPHYALDAPGELDPVPMDVATDAQDATEVSITSV